MQPKEPSSRPTAGITVKRMVAAQLPHDCGAAGLEEPAGCSVRGRVVFAMFGWVDAWFCVWEVYLCCNPKQ
jgi:hypothetical protein